MPVRSYTPKAAHGEANAPQGAANSIPIKCGDGSYLRNVQKLAKIRIFWIEFNAYAKAVVEKTLYCFLSALQNHFNYYLFIKK